MAARNSNNLLATKMPTLWKMIASTPDAYKLPPSVTPPGTYIE